MKKKRWILTLLLFGDSLLLSVTLYLMFVHPRLQVSAIVAGDDGRMWPHPENLKRVALYSSALPSVFLSLFCGKRVLNYHFN